MSRTVSELAQRLNHRNAKGRKIPALLLMTDAKRLPDPSAYIPRLPAGSAVIVRHFSNKQKEEIIKKIRLLCKKHKVKLLVSDSLHLALKYRLDGVHFPEKTVRKIANCGSLKRYPKHLLFTTACHSERALHAAKRAGCHAALLSPIFPTQSHPGAKSLGSYQLTSLSHRSPLNLFALGGITQKTAQRISTCPISGFAGVRGLI
jgi:thiamine-phosphate pyrophosphorylase